MFNCIYVALIAAAIGAAIFLCSSHKDRRYGIYILAAVFSIGVTAWLFEIGAHEGQEGWRITVFLGSVLVAIGWIVSNEVAIANSRKQHTINTIVQMIHSAQVINDKAIIKKNLPHYDTPLTEEVAPFDSENNELIQAVDRELNFLEFIAIAVSSGAMDERLTRECLRTVVIDAVNQYDAYIRYWRAKKPSLWEHLVKYSTSIE